MNAIKVPSEKGDESLIAYAIKAGYAEIVELLAASEGIDLTGALYVARFAGRVGIAKVLIQAGAIGASVEENNYLFSWLSLGNWRYW